MVSLPICISHGKGSKRSTCLSLFLPVPDAKRYIIMGEWKYLLVHHYFYLSWTGWCSNLHPWSGEMFSANPGWYVSIQFQFLQVILVSNSIFIPVPTEALNFDSNSKIRIAHLVGGKHGHIFLSTSVQQLTFFYLVMVSQCSKCFIFP